MAGPGAGRVATAAGGLIVLVAAVLVLKGAASEGCQKDDLVSQRREEQH